MRNKSLDAVKAIAACLVVCIHVSFPGQAGQIVKVFARCAEMYLTRCLGIDNSLCRPDASTGFAYPDDPELKMCIKKYFDMFMQKYCAKEEKNNEKGVFKKFKWFIGKRRRRTREYRISP